MERRLERRKERRSQELPLQLLRVHNLESSAEAFDLASKRGVSCMKALQSLFDKDPIRTIAELGLSIAGWSILMERALVFAALEYSHIDEPESTYSR